MRNIRNDKLIKDSFNENFMKMIRVRNKKLLFPTSQPKHVGTIGLDKLIFERKMKMFSNQSVLT